MPVLEKWGESQQTERNNKAAQPVHVYCNLRGVFVLVLSTDFACGDWWYKFRNAAQRTVL